MDLGCNSSPYPQFHSDLVFFVFCFSGAFKTHKRHCVLFLNASQHGWPSFCTVPESSAPDLQLTDAESLLLCLLYRHNVTLKSAHKGKWQVLTGQEISDTVSNLPASGRDFTASDAGCLQQGRCGLRWVGAVAEPRHKTMDFSQF